MKINNKFNKKLVFKILGIFFMVVGIIGIFLPVFPTTPFVLLAAYLFFNSSPKLFMILINNRLVGQPLYTFMTYRSISLRSKLIGVLFLWTSGTISMYFIDIFYVKLVMFIVFIAVTFHIFSFRNLTVQENQESRESYNQRFRNKNKCRKKKK
ncbi:MAG: hypothetical protein FD141_53 [Fusobacteria bacterium]|nr:MAG: hypothetical protein FD141_53 [Fusobacteriota bacterium]KAF0229283.1 MAG: hypothetical protein FD182_1539 [Fusobacteriota bacterium]